MNRSAESEIIPENQNEANSALKKRPLLRQVGWPLLRWGITLAVLGLMFATLYEARHELGDALVGANWEWLGLALALNLFSSLVYVMVWNSCAKQLGAMGGFRGALVALSVAGAARYIPGAIWPVAGLVYFGPKVGLPRKLMPVLAALAQILHLLAAGLVGVLSFSLLLLNLPLEMPLLLRGLLAAGLALLTGVVIMLLLPRYLTPLLNPLIKLEKPLKLVQPVSYSACFWLLNGIRLWWLALAFGPANFQLLPLLICAGAMTTLLSAVFFFVPLGLGVVEVSLGWWLALVLPWPQVVAIVALNRLLRVINDFVFLGFSRLVK